jgi:hypothetical protein
MIRRHSSTKFARASAVEFLPLGMSCQTSKPSRSAQ